MAYGEISTARAGGGMRTTEHELRQEMVRVGRLMWERGFVAATDGNLSARLGSDRLLVTASGLSKGFLSTDDLVVIRLDGSRCHPTADGANGRRQRFRCTWRSIASGLTCTLSFTPIHRWQRPLASPACRWPAA